MIANSAFIDTDIIMKLGGFKNEDLLSKILISLNENLYVHEYIASEEILIGKNALRQFDEMLKLNQIKIMKESDLNKTEVKDYKSALNVLSDEMNVDLSKPRDKNAGEVKSMAMAFAKNFAYFISDDRGARVAAKKHLHGIDNTYLSTIRMADIIIHLKENEDELGIKRKTAKNLYLYTYDQSAAYNDIEAKRIKKAREYHAKEFDDELWPV